MFKKIKLDLFIKKMNDNDSNNLKYLEIIFEDFYDINKNHQSMLHILCDKYYEENRCLNAIKTILIQLSLNVNREDKNGNTFIHNAINSGYSSSFIYEILLYAITNGYNINSKDKNHDDIFRYFIKHGKDLNKVNEIYELLNNNGYNSNISVPYQDTLLELLEERIYKRDLTQASYSIFKKKYDSIVIDKETEEEIYEEEEEKEIISNNFRKNMKELEKEATILNDNIYIHEPAIGRENELEEFIIALANKRKNPLLVGESGVGKTAIVDELIYKMQRKNVPDYLKKQIIIEINPSSLIAGTKYRGTFEEKIKKIFDYCIENNIIVFIDEIHTIYGAGACNVDDNNDMADTIKYYIDRKGLKVIGTTTKDEYYDWFSKDALKRRFKKVEIKELEKEPLKKVIRHNFNTFSKDYKIKVDYISDEIIDILINSTRPSIRIRDDYTNNPDLIISILDDAFSYAAYNNAEQLEIRFLIKAVNICNRIYPSEREICINKLLSINPNKELNNEPKQCKVYSLSDFKK